MNDAPERIWTDHASREYANADANAHYEPINGGIEYVRADLCAAQPAEAGRVGCSCGKPWEHGPSGEAACLTALTPAPTAQEPHPDDLAVDRFAARRPTRSHP